MRYLLILIIILTLTGEVMAGPKKKKKLEKKWTPVDTTEPVYTEPPKKSIQIGGVTIGGKFGKTPDFNALKKLFKQ